MREILFRGRPLDKYYGEWIEGYYFLDLEVEEAMHFIFNCPVRCPVEPETIGQFTGLTDKNGVKIFEGDIIKIGAEKEVFEVRFEHGCFMAYLNGEQFGLIGELQNCFIEVIGNIYDNPELIQK